MRTAFLTALFALALSCNNKEEKPKAAKTKTVYFPYSSSESNSYQIGDSEHVKTVLEIWRAYDRGNIERLKESFAPNISLSYPEQYMSGARDSILNLWIGKRKQYTTVQSYINSWVPLSTTDTKQNYVMIWAKREFTETSGKVLYRFVHESWKINENGKVESVEHYTSAAWQSE